MYNTKIVEDLYANFDVEDFTYSDLELKRAVRQKRREKRQLILNDNYAEDKVSVIESENDLSDHDSYNNTNHDHLDPKQIKLTKVDHFSVGSITSLKD
jgi:hypothetical protein